MGRLTKVIRKSLKEAKEDNDDEIIAYIKKFIEFMLC